VLNAVLIVVPTVPLGNDGREHEWVDQDSIADELYSLPPEEFTAARDATVKAATDAAVKKAIKALRKPTASAYAVNRIVRERADDIDALLDLGDELRAAMSGHGGDLRQLTEQRRAAVNDLVPADLAANVRDDVTATLEAATADPQLGEAVRSGRLVKPLRYSGFGALPDLDDIVATPVSAGRRPQAKNAATPKKAAAKKAAAKKAAAKKPAAKKTAPAEKAEPPKPDLAPLRQRVLDLAGAADDAQRRYDEAVRAAHQARELLQRAEDERAQAHRAAKEAHAAVEKVRRELGKLERS
jgi:hypothetical protein